MSLNGLSVVIPSRTAGNLNRSAKAVLELEPWARVIVVDDGIHWPDISSEIFGRFTICKGERPFVFARNVNIGINAAGGDDVVLLNDDAVLETPGGFSLLQEAADANPRLGVIAASTNIVGNRNQIRRPGAGLQLEPRMLCFVCVLIPRPVIDSVGMLDEQFIDYGYDDDDYSARARQMGLSLAVHHECYVNHGSLRSTYRGDPRAAGNVLKNKKRFIEKWGTANP